MSDHRELRSLAEGATPGPWWIETTDAILATHTLMAPIGHVASWGDKGKATGDFIAAANPVKVIELLDEIAGLRSSVAP